MGDQPYQSNAVAARPTLTPSLACSDAQPRIAVGTQQQHATMLDDSPSFWLSYRT